ASHNFNSQAVSTSAARKVNAVRPIVNENRSRNNFHKSHSLIRRPFNRTTAPRTNFSYQKVNTVEVKAVSAVGGKRETAVKPSAGCNWRIKRHYWNNFSKYNGGSNSKKCDNPQRALKNKGNCWKHGCSLSVGFYHHTTNGHQFTMSNKHQELASPEQTTSGKDFSNPLIVDSLLKTIWFINAPCFCNEALAIPGQMATGKELSNLFMAGSFPKTTLSPKLLE
ncbi:hypothetical protein Tco_1522146, partial [Tanacetum coccineum]